MSRTGRAGGLLRLGGRLSRIAVVLVACNVMPTQALSVEGDAVAVGNGTRGSPSMPRFQFRVHQCPSWMRSEWRSPDGNLVAWDEVEFDGVRWRSYRLVRPTLGQDFRQQAATVSSQPGHEPFLAGPMLIDYARHELGALRNGATREVRYLIAESGQDIRLRLRALRSDSDGTSVGVDAAQVWLRPLVPRAQIHFDAAGRFTAMQGQILPQAGTARHPEPIQADVSVRGSGPTSACHN